MSDIEFELERQKRRAEYRAARLSQFQKHPFKAEWLEDCDYTIIDFEDGAID